MTSSVTRCTRRYGIGHNSLGGVYIQVGDDRVYERLTRHAGGFPADGGPNPRWERLEAALGKWPLKATDEEILAAWDA